MATGGEIAQAYVRIRPNAAGFQKEAEAQVQGALAGVRKTAALLIGAGGIAEGVKGILEAATGKQSALVQVETGVKNVGAAWKVYGETVEEALDKQENRSGFDFEELAQGFGRLEQQTKNSATSLDLLGVAENVARARHLELAQVTVALAKAQAGNSTSLQRLGIIVPKYTANVDALKGKLADIAAAEEAQAQSRAKVYDGTRKLTAEQQRLAALNPVQLAALKDQTKAQEGVAAANDKRASSEQAIAEVTRRYAGQSDAYAKTAAGSYARFRVAVQQVAETIGTQALPELSQLASRGAAVALQLSKSEQAGRIAHTVLDDIGGAAHAAATAFETLEPALKLTAEAAQAIGPGPLLAAYAAYRAVALAQSAATVVEGRYQKLVKAGTPIQAARAAALEAETAANAGAVASGSRLLAFEAALAEGYTATTAANQANNGQTVSNTELTTLNTAARIRNGEVAALQAEGYSEVTAVTMLNNGQVVTSTELQAANTLAREGNIAATEAQTVATTGWRVALAGAGSILTGPVGISVGLAAAAAGIYYLSTLQTDSARITDATTDAYNRAGQAAKAAGDAAKGVQTATGESGSAIRGRADATEALASARGDLNKLLDSGKYTAGQVADAERRIADREADWRAANQRVIDTEAAKVEAVKKSTKAIDDQRTAQKALIDQQVANLKIQASVSVRAGAAANGIQPGDNLATLTARKIADSYRQTADGANAATAAQRFNLRVLADYIEATGKVPTEVQTRLVLNDKQAYASLAAFEATARGAAGALLDALTGKGNAAAPARGGVSIPVDSKKTAELGKAAATTFTTSFVQHLDASSISTALSDAVTQAQAQLVSETGTLASTIGQALDAKLKAQTLPATQEIARLQAQIAASQAASQARDTGQAVADAAKKLADLQRVFGSGALTADQAQSIQQAQVALADAQDAATTNAKEGRIAVLQAGVDAAGKANDAEKAAASRRLADLDAELNDGLITQRTYVKRLNALLASEGVNYKSTGKLLGISFADGFRDGLSSVIAQATALAGFGKKGAGAIKAIDPAKAEADAIKAFVDSIASSGGKFDVTGAGKLPPGVTLAQLLAQAGAQRGSDAYTTPSGAKTNSAALDYAGRTADHTAQVVAELRKLNAKKETVHVVVDGSKAKRKTAAATRS